MHNFKISNLHYSLQALIKSGFSNLGNFLFITFFANLICTKTIYADNNSNDIYNFSLPIARKVSVAQSPYEMITAGVAFSDNSLVAGRYSNNLSNSTAFFVEGGILEDEVVNDDLVAGIGIHHQFWTTLGIDTALRLAVNTTLNKPADGTTVGGLVLIGDNIPESNYLSWYLGGGLGYFYIDGDTYEEDELNPEVRGGLTLDLGGQAQLSGELALIQDEIVAGATVSFGLLR
jgi:hypothetical protein